jgi:hypothetical protein
MSQTAHLPKFQTPESEEFRKNILSFKFNLFTLAKLPSAWFSGVRVKSLDYEKAEVTVPYKWFSQNPFQSTYFACLAMAAEMSTGLPCLMAIWKSKPPISMLVVDIQGNFTKKATNVTTFVCNDVQKVFEAVERAKQSGQGETVETLAVGTDKFGDEVARFKIVWSFKKKSK